MEVTAMKRTFGERATMAAKPVPIITTRVGPVAAAPSPLPSAVREKSETSRMARFICYMFDSVISRTLETASEQQMLMVLNAGLPKYFVLCIENILKYTQCPLPTIMLGLYYLHSLRAKYPDIQDLEPRDKMKLFSILMMLAQKYTEDHPFGNKVWAKLSGLNARDLAQEELLVLERMGFSLYVPLTEYASFCKRIQLLAKEWNRKLLHIAKQTVPMTPVVQTPVTPSVSIPEYIKSIDTRIRKRSHPDIRQIETPRVQRRRSEDITMLSSPARHAFMHKLLSINNSMAVDSISALRTPVSDLHSSHTPSSSSSSMYPPTATTPRRGSMDLNMILN